MIYHLVNTKLEMFIQIPKGPQPDHRASAAVSLRVYGAGPCQAETLEENMWLEGLGFRIN